MVMGSLVGLAAIFSALFFVGGRTLLLCKVERQLPFFYSRRVWLTWLPKLILGAGGSCISCTILLSNMAAGT
jgi:hypothetical protein